MNTLRWFPLLGILAAMLFRSLESQAADVESAPPWAAGTVAEYEALTEVTITFRAEDVLNYGIPSCSIVEQEKR